VSVSPTTREGTKSELVGGTWERVNGCGPKSIISGIGVGRKSGNLVPNGTSEFRIDLPEGLPTIPSSRDAPSKSEATRARGAASLERDLSGSFLVSHVVVRGWGTYKLCAGIMYFSSMLRATAIVKRTDTLTFTHLRNA
jgi:hypothetical protein